MQSVVCQACDHLVDAGARFCGNCGADVRQPRYESPADAPHERSLLEALRRATIGEYEIREELGRGGMAMVFLAHDLRLNKKVAIKVLSPHLQMMPGMAARFLREAQTAAALEHPNIIPIYAYRETSDFAFFTMRYVEGASLSAMAREIGQLPVPVVRTLLSDVGGALAFAHAHGVLHRDVKPGNVLLGRDGVVMVTDFGIAKQAEGQALTLTGQLLGTPGYMSPEQCRGSDLSFASDQYSLGVMAFELLAGRGPFTGSAAGELMAQHLMQPPLDLRVFRPDCPSDLVEAVMRMLAKDPLERFASIEEALFFARALPVLPSDPVRVQLRTWAESPVHARNLANTPVSPILRSPVAAPTPTAMATPVVQPVPAPQTVLDAAFPDTSPTRRETEPTITATVRRSRRLVVALGSVAALLTIAVVALAIRQANKNKVPVVVGDTASVAMPAAEKPTQTPAQTPAPTPAQTRATTPTPTTKGTLIVTGLPGRGSIRVDGRQTSGSRIQLERGHHTIRLQAPGFVAVDTAIDVVAGVSWTLVFASKRVEIAAQNPVASTAQRGVLMLRVRPFAKVFVDGVLATEDERLVVTLPEGRHALRFEKTGFVTLDTAVMVPRADTLKKLFTLQPQTP